MIKRSIIASLALATSIAANAAPKWVELPYSMGDTSFLDHSSFISQGDFVDVNVLRNFDNTIVLGSDPASGAAMYSHRSVKLNYRVNCDSRKVALTGWEMYGGNFGSGEVVWANANRGTPAFLTVVDEETRAVMISACAINIVSR